MLDSFAVATIAGVIFGFLAGLGVGGGSLLMLWLTTVLHTDYTVARTINLLFFIPTALIGCWFRSNQGILDLKKVAPAIIFGVVSAALFSLISKHIDIIMIRQFFGMLLLITGLRELFYRPRKDK